MAGFNVRSVLVTGANRGIGLELVKQLLEKSNPPEWVFATCRDPEGERAQQLKNLVSRHPNLVIVALEATDPASIKAAATRVEEHLKGSGLNLLINNAAVLKLSTLESETPEDMSLVYTTNVTGPLLVSQAALNMLTKCQSLGYEGDGILSIAVHPGWVQTDMGISLSPEAPVTVDASVRGILNVLPTLSQMDNGAFVSWEGKVLPW
ncbi:C-factor-like isoform X2 [Gopherus flavomarginatus]|uniref:C-factor-like isoform X2 n=1 Tax=Gopherus flavomarginatus TaxID=286002 RepID=UPI0021CBF22D|nr:C-factor-like isoform X2 [Gopherus flavomarginatus]